MAKSNRILSRKIFRIKGIVENLHEEGKLLDNAKKTLRGNVIELKLVELKRCYKQILTYIERFQDKRPSIREGWDIINSLNFYENPVFIKGYIE